jgi:GT2 family glycosyltransferase
MANKPKVAVIIVNWNGKDDTVECLKSLRRVSTFNYDLSIILVDNASTNDSVEVFNKITDPSFRLVKSETNLGFAGGNNLGIKIALEEGADWILLLNNDTLADKNLIKELVKGAENYTSGGIFSPKIYFAPGFEFYKDKYPKYVSGKVIWSAGGKMDWDNVFGVNIGVDDVDRGQYDEAKEIDFATGACVLINKKVFEKIGLLSLDYFMYLEDTDFCHKAKLAGFKIYYLPQAYLWHRVGKSSGIGGDLNDYFISRNRLIFGFRYASLRTKFALFRESVKLLVTGRKWQKRGIIDFYLHKWGKGSWGSKK